MLGCCSLVLGFLSFSLFACLFCVGFFLDWKKKVPEPPLEPASTPNSGPLLQSGQPDPRFQGVGYAAHSTLPLVSEPEKAPF